MPWMRCVTVIIRFRRFWSRHRKLPEEGWDDDVIEYIVRELSQMDTNRFPFGSGAGEREGRMYSNVVARRHFGFAHGIGRSGDLSEAQPKAIGATILSDITNRMLRDLVRLAGLRKAKKCMMVPMATGMTLMFTMLHFQRTRKLPEDPKIVLWSRIDQKSCFKSMTSGGFHPLIIDTIRRGDLLCTDVEAFRREIESLGANNILCIMSTTSCFAPRGCDDIIALAKLAQEHGIPHVVNNAYGLQSSLCTHQIEQAVRLGGRVDYVVQSTDKNLMVPVGGSIVVAFEEGKIEKLAKTYPGRASISQTIDVFITLLSMGQQGFMKLLQQQKECFAKLVEIFQQIAKECGEKVLETQAGNRISLTLTLTTFTQKDRATEVGYRLYRAGITGARVVPKGETKTIEGYTFENWGGHTSTASNAPYITAAAAIGCEPHEIQRLFRKLKSILVEIRKEISQIP
uniref:O-phosphoseryl-tRNA(Sec) selenium transferase n=1 Tax=Lutzomyia longipalpis TaxID=7200 RepID=A0A1B0CW45_LUTLO